MAVPADVKKAWEGEDASEDEQPVRLLTFLGSLVGGGGGREDVVGLAPVGGGRGARARAGRSVCGGGGAVLQ